MTEVSTKLFRLDLDYFKENFLNQETWGQKHLLYENSTIQVTLEQDRIETSAKELSFYLNVKIIDAGYFERMFGVVGNENWYWYNDGSSRFEIPIEHEEYTVENFVKKVYGEFKYALKSALYAYDTTPLMAKIRKLRNVYSDKVEKEATDIYQKSRATKIKDVISKNVFVHEYLKKDKYITELNDKIRNIETKLRYALMEKDTELFCDILGLEYKQDEEIEKYYEAVAAAKELLNENS